MKEYYYCIDIGGTTIKGGIVSEDNQILFQDKVSTKPIPDTNYLADSILDLIEILEEKSGYPIIESEGLGIGSPGMIDSPSGVICFAGNLKLKDYNLVEALKEYITVPIKIANDADIATLAEKMIGAGKNYKNFVMLTIGTGIGSGIVLNDKLYSWHVPYSGEIGHMKISDSGIKCSCGETNCYEALASTKALVRMTKEAMEKNPDSKMWKKYNLSSANGKTVFEFKDTDAVAKQVFDEYIKNLGNGIVNLVNILFPEAIIIGGAISNQKDELIAPLKKYVDEHIYAKHINYKANIITAELTGDAGIIGGKFLFDKEI